MPKNEFSLPDPVAAFEKRIQRAKRAGLVGLEIEATLSKPATLGEMRTLSFSEDTIRLLERLSESEETGLEIDVSDRNPGPYSGDRLLL